jgi:hypothetical protein
LVAVLATASYRGASDTVYHRKQPATQFRINTETVVKPANDYGRIWRIIEAV